MDTRDQKQLAALLAALGSEPKVTPLLFEQLLNLLEEFHPALAQLAALSAQAGATVAADFDGAEWVRGVSRYLTAKPKEMAEEIMGRPEQAADDNPLGVDVLVLTVKKVEFNAAFDALGVQRAGNPRSLAFDTEVWITEIGGCTFALSSIGTDGNVESALKIAALLQGLRCRAAFLVGMAAGVKGKVSAGDVVVSEEVWAADFQILRPGGFVPRPKTYDAPLFMYSGLSTFDAIAPDWGETVKSEIIERFEHRTATGDPKPPSNYKNLKRLPKVSTGVIFAGSRLIEDGSLVSRRRDEHGRLLAAEMEGAGFAAAIKEQKFTHWLVVRGIADFADEGRVKNWQYASAYAAAALVREGSLNGRFPLADRPFNATS